MTFIEFAEERGLIINSLVHGKWARVPTVDHPHKRNGAYWFGGEFGHCQNWAVMDKVESWQDKRERTPFEQQDMQKRMETSRKQYTQERARMQQEAAKKATNILSECVLERHAYLDAHGLGDDVGMVWHHDENNYLVIPMRVHGVISGIQKIDRDGGKRFMFGQRCDQAQYVIGQGKLSIWCEGYCTGLAIRKAVAALKLDCAIHVCFSAGNMLKLAKSHGSGIVIADYDASRVGEESAKATGLPYFLPDTVGWDFCDIYQARGLFRASQELRKFLSSVK